LAKPDVGDPAPEFELPGTGDKMYALADYAGTGVILTFYPGDFTPVCTKQFCSYRDDADRIDGLGMPMLGISPQSVSSHERFMQEKSLNVPLLADEDKTVAGDYGVLFPGGFVRRSVFVVDGDLVIRHRDVKLLGGSYQSVDDIEQALAGLR